MTRRKRTPSPSPSSPPKRVAFEIPPSLQQLSTVSRSLATRKDSHGSAPSGQSTTYSHPQPRPTSRSSSHSAASLSTGSKMMENAVPQVIPQKRSSAEGQVWHQPRPRNHLPAAASEQGGERGKHSIAASGSSPFAASQPRTAVATSSKSPQDRRQSIPVPSSDPPEEPVLQPGETPTLTTHPALIASLIAKKRAENEAKGMRERWARRQAEYRMSKSPASQTESNPEAGRNEGHKPHPQAISNPLPAWSVLPSKEPYAPALSRLANQTPAAEAVSTPATEASAKGTDTPKATPAGEDESLFGSPFSSPMAEFLERATDTAGLKDGVEQAGAVPARISAGQTSISRTSDVIMRPGVSQSGETSKHPKFVTIPPLFSDSSNAAQSATQNQTYLGGLASNASLSHNQQTTMQRQYQTSSSIHPPHSTPRQASFESTLSVGSQLPPMAQRYPYFQQVPSPGGFYKIDFRTSNVPSSISSSMHESFTPSPYDKSPAQADPQYPNYPIGNSPMYSMASQLEGQIPGYGAASAMPVTPEQTKLQSSSSNSITSADMFAGINTRFKISTKDDFVVPKR